MGYYGSTFTALCADAWGEALSVRVSVRLNDGVDGAPDTLVELTDGNTVISLNPVTTKREHAWGVMQAQVWQIRLTDEDGALRGYDLLGCYCALEGEFIDEAESALFAQGTIARVIPDTGASIALEVHSPAMNLLNWELPRDIYFQDTGWAGNIQAMSKDQASSQYTNDYDDDGTDEGVTVHTASNCRDETYVIEFTTATAYSVTCEDGTPQTGKQINQDEDITSEGSSGTAVTIETEGWDQTGSAYAVGDIFVFYTAVARSANELSPVYMIEHLIEDVVDLEAYDVATGAAYGSPLYDTSNWTTSGTAAAGDEIGGFWAKGTKISKLIQDALKVVHGAIFVAPTGQIALWVLSPTTEVGVHFNGDPALGTVNLLAPSSIAKDADIAVNRLLVEYLDINSGDDAVIEQVDTDSAFHDVKTTTVSIGWRALGTAVDSSASKYMNRFKGGRTLYTLSATLAGAALDMTQALTITDPVLGLTLEQADVNSIAVDLVRNMVTVEAYADPVTNADYAVVGTSVVDGGDGHVVW